MKERTNIWTFLSPQYIYIYIYNSPFVHTRYQAILTTSDIDCQKRRPTLSTDTVGRQCRLACPSQALTTTLDNEPLPRSYKETQFSDNHQEA